jgi:hypothetical protein
MQTVEGSPRYSALRIALLMILIGMLTVTLQRWVGYFTIYEDQLAEKRLMQHNAILNNEPPLGKKWDESGANRTNVRVFAVYLAEVVHRVTGVPVLRTYVLLDTVALACVFAVLFAYVRAWVPPPIALLGLLYFAFVVTLTYHLHYFHPWDRLSLLCWILGAMFIKDDRYVPLLLLLPIAVTVKWDIIALPALYLLAHWSRGRRTSVALRTLALAAVSATTLLALAKAFPGGLDRPGTLIEVTRWQLSQNWRDFAGLQLGYPPLLAFSLPILLAGFEVRTACRFLRASFLFALVLFIPLLLSTNFVEIRAQMMILVLLLPTALLGLSELLGSSRKQETEN